MYELPSIEEREWAVVVNSIGRLRVSLAAAAEGGIAWCMDAGSAGWESGGLAMVKVQHAARSHTDGIRFK